MRHGFHLLPFLPYGLPPWPCGSGTAGLASSSPVDLSMANATCVSSSPVPVTLEAQRIKTAARVQRRNDGLDGQLGRPWMACIFCMAIGLEPVRCAISSAIMVFAMLLR